MRSGLPSAWPGSGSPRLHRTLAGVSAVQSLFSYALLGAPFALVAAILLAPPSVPQRKVLVTVALALAFIQVPITIAQAPQATHADQIQGTFVGSQAGAHLVGALCVVAALWIVARARTAFQALAAAPLLVVPFLSEANATLLAMPIGLLAMPVLTGPVRRLRKIVVIGVLAVLLGNIVVQGEYTLRVVEQAASVVRTLTRCRRPAKSKGN